MIIHYYILLEVIIIINHYRVCSFGNDNEWLCLVISNTNVLILIIICTVRLQFWHERELKPEPSDNEQKNQSTTIKVKGL